MTRRIALKLQYDGSRFWGWQRQSRHRSVQAVLEDVLAQKLGQAVVVHGAGRTDTGVHAAGQVAHFDADSAIPAERWVVILNHLLPPDIAILAAAEVPMTWHCRFSAAWRRYRFLLLNQQQADVFWRPLCWHYRPWLDVKLMAHALESIVGEHDMVAFRGAGSERKHSRVRVDEVSCQRRGNLISVEVQANGFLYRMMRLLIGALVFVGQAEITPAQFGQMWQRNDWRMFPNRLSVPPQGLCLIDVGYAEDPFAELRQALCEGTITALHQWIWPSLAWGQPS